MFLNATGTKNADDSCKNFKTNNICVEDDQATSSRPQCQCFVSASRGLVNMYERSTGNWGKKIWSGNHESQKYIQLLPQSNILKLPFLLGISCSLAMVLYPCKSRQLCLAFHVYAKHRIKIVFPVIERPCKKQQKLHASAVSASQVKSSSGL